MTYTHCLPRAKTFLEHPHIHTCFLSPAESALQHSLCGSTGRQSSMSAFPIEENLSIGSHCSAWYEAVSPGFCLCDWSRRKQSFLRNAFTKQHTGSKEDSSYKQSLSIMKQGGLHKLCEKCLYLECFRLHHWCWVLYFVWTEITTAVPVIVSTNGPKTMVTVTVESAVWITTVTVPPVIAETGTCSLDPLLHSHPSTFDSTPWVDITSC